jgi:hypothetical protein
VFFWGENEEYYNLFTFCFMIVNQATFGQYALDSATRLEILKNIENYIDSFDSQIPSLTPKNAKRYKNEVERYRNQIRNCEGDYSKLKVLRKAGICLKPSILFFHKISPEVFQHVPIIYKVNNLHTILEVNTPMQITKKGEPYGPPPFQRF